MHEPTLGFRLDDPRRVPDRFFRTVATSLATAPTGTAMLWEEVLGTRSVGLFVNDPAVRPPESAIAFGIRPARSPIDLRSPRPTDRVRPRIVLLRPQAGPAHRSALVPPRRSVAGTWVASQTFWVAREGGLWVARRLALTGESDGSVVLDLARGFAEQTGRAIESVPAPHPRTAWNDWRHRSMRGCRWPDGAVLSATTAAATGRLETCDSWSVAESLHDHLTIFGASGSGKTEVLVQAVRSAARQGFAVFGVDLHGDLGPAVAQSLDRGDRDRLVAVDVTVEATPGIAVLGGSTGERSTRSAAHLVAALKRLTPDGNDTYWGFRLERIFEAFARHVVDEGGSLFDLYDLLTDPRRREAAHLTTRRLEVARLLEELPRLERRSPDLLWPAAARVAKIALLPEITRLLAPTDGLLPVEATLARGRIVLVRIPFGVVGPEASAFAATLLLSHVYLAAADPAAARERPPLLFILDEAHLVAPRLVAEILSDGRKYGITALLATQFPDRLAPEVRAAAAGAVGRHLLLRLPAVSARLVGSWAGLTDLEAMDIVPELEVGEGIVDRPTNGRRWTRVSLGAPGNRDPGEWVRATRRSAEEFGAMRPAAPELEEGTLDDELLLAVLSAQESGSDRSPAQIVRCAFESANGADPAVGIRRLDVLLGRGWLTARSGQLELSEAGERRLGLGAPTGATTESAEHRTLLHLGVRLLARHGLRMEILRQGRFDTTLPDGRVRLLRTVAAGSPPYRWAEALRRTEPTWAWRFFGGRDVDVEAEVSGALRPERIRHGLKKARAHDAFALFLVGDAGRARRVRTVLRSENVPRDRAQVWTLSAAQRVRGSELRGAKR